MIIIDTIKQQSDEWFIEKAGKPSSSSFNKIITSRGNSSDQREDYLDELAGEFIIGKREKGYVSKAMEEGTAREAESRAAFSLLEGVEVKEVGMIYDNSKSYLCSPDGLLKNSGLELKNPLLKTHVRYLREGVFPTIYKHQTQGSLLVTEFDYWWFMSYYPGLPEFKMKIGRDEDFISRLKDLMDSFLYDLAMRIRMIKERV